MERKLNQINVSLTSNRDCNLKCNHCYITKEEKASNKERMSISTIEKALTNVEKIINLDRTLTELEWELIGGEPTRMPYEFWEVALPKVLEASNRINRKYNLVGDVNFITNLLFNDRRYFKLFKKCSEKYSNFYMYISWEPDTGRFGNNNKLETKFFENLKELQVNNLTIGTVFTKGLIELTAKGFINKFRDTGISDLSIEMLSPFGDGNVFWRQNSVTFTEMSNFFIELEREKPSFSYSPKEEMLKSLRDGIPIHCDGNYKYDLCIEPSGETHFNSSRSGDEKVDSGEMIAIEDPQWAYKVAFQNSDELLHKITYEHPECHQCQFLPYCNAGWYHYKNEKLGVELKALSQDECSGMKKVWRQFQETHPISQERIISDSRLRDIISSNSVAGRRVNESELQHLKYDEYLTFLSDEKPLILMDVEEMYGFKYFSRAVFYNAVGLKIDINTEIKRMPIQSEKYLKHILYSNLNATEINADYVWSAIFNMQPSLEKSLYIDALNQCLPALGYKDLSVIGSVGNVKMDCRNLELIKWILKNPPEMKQVDLLRTNERVSNPFILEVYEGVNLQRLLTLSE